MSYSIDTSSLIEASHRHYPLDSFPGFWQGLSDLITGGRLLAVDEVLEEIKRKDDELHKWAKSQEGLFVPIDDDLQTEVTNILKRFPTLMKQLRKARSGADPWVIALAKVQKLTVITEEDRGTKDKPKIPYVCLSLGIRSIRLVELIKNEGWRFHMTP